MRFKSADLDQINDEEPSVVGSLNSTVDIGTYAKTPEATKRVVFVTQKVATPSFVTHITTPLSP